MGREAPNGWDRSNGCNVADAEHLSKPRTSTAVRRRTPGVCALHLGTAGDRLPAGITMTEPTSALVRQDAPTHCMSTAVAPTSDQSDDRAALMRGAVCGGDAAELSRAHGVPGAGVSGRSWPSPMAGFVSRWPTPSVVIVDVHGEIDVTNATTMTDYALAHAISGRGLVLDLSEVDFLGTEGFSALHRVAVGCARIGTACSLVPGAVASRLLRICDPRGLLAAADSVEVALAAVQHQVILDHGSSRAS